MYQHEGSPYYLLHVGFLLGLFIDPEDGSHIIPETTVARNMRSYNSNSLSVSTATVQRGDKKIGDKCNETKECGFDGAVCSGDKKSTCQCIPELPASNHIDKCGKGMYESPAHDSRRTMVCAEHSYPARPSNSIS
jgi:hypothetical protein